MRCSIDVIRNTNVALQFDTSVGLTEPIRIHPKLELNVVSNESSNGTCRPSKIDAYTSAPNNKSMSTHRIAMNLTCCVCAPKPYGPNKTDGGSRPLGKRCGRTHVMDTEAVESPLPPNVVLFVCVPTCMMLTGTCRARIGRFTTIARPVFFHRNTKNINAEFDKICHC